MLNKLSKIGLLFTSISVFSIFPPQCVRSIEEKPVDPSKLQGPVNSITDLFARKNSNATETNVAKNDAAHPSWPPVSTSTVNLFAPPPLLVYGQPNASPKRNGLRILPHQPQQDDPLPNPYLQSSSTSSIPLNSISSIPSPISTPSITSHRLTTPHAPDQPNSVTDSPAHRRIHVLTTPFGLAWRQVGFFLNRSRTTPARSPGVQPPPTVSFAADVAPSPRPPSTTEDSTLQGNPSLWTPGGINQISTKPAAFKRTKWPDSPAPNRIKGKPHILCMANGIMFISETYFAFDGVIFAEGHQNSTNCAYDSNRNNGEIRDRSINVSFPYLECGDPIIAQKGDHMYQTDVVVSFNDGRIQTFLARCVSQKLHYEDEELPKKIEEALAERNITPTVIETQAAMPMCTMRVIQEIEQEQHRYGPSNLSAVHDAFIGQQLRMEFSLDPPSAAFGFLIRNCTVLDSTVDMRYVVIDDKGCSVDINILAHPHYDTYHDLAIVHWHAFKVPDSALLSFSCDCAVCTEMADDTGQTSCEQIPTPPVCPDVVTSSVLQNALIFDSSQNEVLASKKKRREATQQNVRTGFCLKTDPEPENCAVNLENDDDQVTDNNGDHLTMCLSKWVIAVLSGLNLALLATSLLVLFLIVPYHQRKRRRIASASATEPYLESVHTNCHNVVRNSNIVR